MQLALHLSLVVVFAGIASSTPALDSTLQNGLDFTSDILKKKIPDTVRNGLDLTDNFLKPKSTDKTSTKKVPEMIQANGYPVESHYITTSDGYILNVHRIPHGKNGRNTGKVAYLQHGILSSSTDWILAGPGKGLAYILADEGYDVWMGNVRGNAYSRNHTTLNPDNQSDFWQFSWHEIGTIDMPEIIDYVIARTRVDGVYYVGHSQGTTVFYVMASFKPEYNQKIKAQVSLAPIGFMNHMTSPLLRIIGMWEKSLGVLLDLIGKDEFLPKDGFMSMLSSAVCTEGIGSLLCGNALFAICGFSPKQMNVTLIPELVAHYPAGAATKQLLHYGQEMNSGRFCQYNMGVIGNTRKYGSMVPPDYNLDEITAPVYLIYSENDWLAAVKDVDRLARVLGNLKEKILVSDPKWNHLDFTFGIDAPRLVYRKVLDIFKNH
uniref:Lipase n=1 Tax=Colaphellus bowringi TaxID=561076 RepID=A0A8U0AWE9_9CUCU|nr:triacylglycerol lipase 1 [Colaphellus bowringi]